MKANNADSSTRLRAVLAFLAMLSTSACTVGPDFQKPPVSTGSAYVNEQPSALGDENTGVQTLTTANQVGWGWWQALGNKQLNMLVEQGLKKNPSVASAEARLERARHIVGVVNGQTSPRVELGVGAGRTRIGAAALGPDFKDTPTFSAHEAGLGAVFDLDLFGGIKRAVELTSAQEDVAQAEKDATMLRVSAAIVEQSLQAAVARSELQSLTLIVDAETQRLALLKSGTESGAVGQEMVDRQSRKVSELQAKIPGLKQKIAVSQDALAALLGEMPGHWSPPSSTLADFSLPAEIPMIVPSELANQRPDIKAAEARLHAASAAVGIATANLYPKVSLSATLSEQGIFSGPAGVAWSALASLSAPIFDGGSLRATKGAAEADYRAAYADYQKVVVNAFAQISNQLYALSNDAESSRASHDALVSATASARRAELAYSAGSISNYQRIDALQEQQSFVLLDLESRFQRLADSAALILSTTGSISANRSGMVSR
ncbi:efflux transporter outer membrane subunit [Pseudomonas syringae]|uniref:RND transporter n=1 Tax=Pseudomonas syringae TaxID=317 RepID=A0A085V8K2_PSESX|nr:efflux transporter outer membrane subunit [Pseudomonas syringae]KFE51765.1 hypothetical protein IV02_11335 [Pseudomonas syringae]